MREEKRKQAEESHEEHGSCKEARKQSSSVENNTRKTQLSLDFFNVQGMHG